MADEWIAHDHPNPDLRIPDGWGEREARDSLRIMHALSDQVLWELPDWVPYGAATDHVMETWRLDRLDIGEIIGPPPVAQAERVPLW